MSQKSAFSSFCWRFRDAATTENIRRFQLHQHEHGGGPATIDGAASDLRSMFVRPFSGGIWPTHR